MWGLGFSCMNVGSGTVKSTFVIYTTVPPSLPHVCFSLSHSTPPAQLALVFRHSGFVNQAVLANAADFWIALQKKVRLRYAHHGKTLLFLLPPKRGFWRKTLHWWEAEEGGCVLRHNVPVCHQWTMSSNCHACIYIGTTEIQLNIQCATWWKIHISTSLPNVQLSDMWGKILSLIM